MKKLLLLLLALPIFSFAQESDWFPIPSDQVSYFKSGNIYEHISTIKIDSIIQTDSGTLYYNVKNPERVGGDEEHVYYDPFSSWLGKTTLAENGNAHFYDTESFKPITVNYSRADNTPWLFYESESYYYEANIESFDYIEILDGVFDSVKYIDLQYYSESKEINELYFDHAIILSKNYGLIKTIPFNKDYLNSNNNYRELIGIETEEGNNGWEYKFDEYITNYQIGDELHNTNSENDFIDIILDKTQTQDYVEYTYKRCIDDGENSIYSKKILLGKYPGQTIINESSIYNQGYYDFFYMDDDWQGYHQHHFQFFFEYREYEYNGEFVWRYTPEGSNCLRVPMYGCNKMNNSIIEDCAWQQWYIKYFDNADITYGEPWDFECDATSIEADWFPMPSEQLSYFATINEGGGNIPTDYTSFYPMMIDSIKYDGDAMIYYNVKTPVFIGDDDDSYNFYDPYQTWFGYSVRFEDGMAEFQNSKEEEIFIKYNQESNEPWLCYTYENGEYIQAYVSEFSQIEILEGLTDSVKHIAFQSYNLDGEITESSINEKSITISKNYGFVETFSFNNFPYSNIKQLTTLEAGDMQYGFNFTFNELISSYKIDDTIHMQVFDDNYYIKRNIIAKDLSDDFVEYTTEECSKYYDRIDFKETKYKYYKRLARQSIFDENGNPIGFYNISSYNNGEKAENDYLVTFMTDIKIEEFNGKLVWAIEYDLGHAYSQEINRANDICVYRYTDRPGDFSELLYYNTSIGQWGKALDYNCNTGIETVTDDNISIMPNPSNGIFKINNNSSQKIEEIKIINTKGQVVFNKNISNNTQHINISEQATGLYMVEIKLGNGQFVYEKLLFINKN